MNKIASTWLLLAVLLSSTSLFAQDETLSGPGGCGAGANSGTWTVPCDVTSVTVEVYGGGGGAGGGGGGSNGGFYDTRGGGGAGGGGYTTITIDVTPGSTFSFSAGSGGCGGGNGSDFNDGDSGNGGTSSAFSGTDGNGNPVNLTANGGAGGGGGDGTEGSPGSGGAGGSASGGSTNTTGTAGSNGSGGNGGVGGAGAGPSGGAGGASVGASGNTLGGGGAGGGDSNGGVGASGGILITYVNQGSLPVTPIIVYTPETCSADGISTISNYDPLGTYVFTPAGPTVAAGGVINSMVIGTSYTVVSGTGVCASTASLAFSNSAATGTVVDPIISTIPPTCTADGSSTITTYNATATYTFSPAGPTVAAGGVISGMTVGTSYTVTESDLTCTSAPSAAFVNDAQFPAPNIAISGTLSYCAGSNTTITASGGTTYLWDDPASSTSSGITVTQGTYTVIGTDANGCTATASAIVVESAPFAITFSGPLSHCVGGNTTITASGGSTYLWDNGETTATVTLTQGTYSVTATDASGCLSTDNVIITETATPTADFIVIDACAGTPLQFNDVTFIVSGNLTGWAWDFGDGDQSALQNPTHVYALPGTFDVVLTVSSGNCSDQITIQATSFPNPVADFTSTNACEGTAATFTDNSSVTGSVISQWAWDFDGLSNSTQQSPTYVFANSGTYNVTLGVITSDLCADTYTDQITIYPAPVAAFSTTDVCQGNTTTFQNQSTVGSGSISLQAWDFGDNLGTSLALSPTYNYAVAGVYSVTLGVTSSDGCLGLITQDVTVNSLPSIDALHTDVLCADEANGTATAAALGGTSPYTFLWDDVFQSTTASILNLGPGPYMITVADALGCMSDTTVTVLEPLPIIVTLVPGDDTCGLGNGTIQAIMTGGTAPFEYVWSAINDSTSIYSEDFTPSGWNTLLASGDYSVEVLDAGGCTTTGETTIDQILPPEAKFSTRSKPEELIDPTVEFNNQSVGAYSYEWHFGDGNLSFEEYPVHDYDTNGVFLVMLIAENEPQFGCVDTTYQFVEVAPLVTFYIPNAFTPNGNGVNDTWGPKGQNFEFESYNVQVFDRWGKLVWQTDDPDQQWDGNHQKSQELAPRGVYVYQFLIKEYNTFEPKKLAGSITLYRHR